MQKIILDTIEEFDKKFHILKYEQDGEQHEGFRASKVPNSKDVKDFLKQALTKMYKAGIKQEKINTGRIKKRQYENGFKAGQKSREKIDEEALEKGLKNFRKLRLVDHEPLMDEAPPAETVLSVLKQGLGGMFDNQAVKYIYEKAIKYYLKSLSLTKESK